MPTELLVVLAMTDDTKVRELPNLWRRPARPWLNIVLITMLALAVRLAWLGSKSLWADEADSFYFASHTLPDIFSRLCDPHPPGYYALLRVFLTYGQDEFWVRLPSAIAGALAVPLLYALSRELDAAFGAPWLDRRTAVLASLLLAVAPLHVWYSQEARMYALVTALGLCSVYFALRFALHRHMADALGYVLAAAAALYTDQSSALPLLLANLLWGGLWLYRRRWFDRKRSDTHHELRVGRGWWELVTWAGLQVLVGAAFWLWWSQALFSSLFDSGTLYQLAMVMLVLRQLGLPVTLAGVRWTLVVGAAALTAAGVSVCLLLARCRWMRGLVRVLAPAVVALYVLVTIGSAVPRGFTVKRLLVSLLPYGLLISAWAIRKLQFKRWLLPALVIFALVLCVVNVLLVPKEPWREIVTVVQRELGPNDLLWVDELVVPAFDYYYSGSHERLILRVARLHEWSSELSNAWNADHRSSAGGGYIWIVTMIDPYRNLLDYLPASLSQRLAWSGDWHRVSVRAYAPPPPGTSPPISDTGADLPAWLLAWPSPVDEACEELGR